MQDGKKRICIIYAKGSTRALAEVAASELADQCKSQDFVPAHIFFDSVYLPSSSRPSLRKAIAAAELQKEGFLIVNSIEDLGPSVSSLVKVIERLFANGMSFMSVREGIVFEAGGTDRETILIYNLIKAEQNLRREERRSALRIASMIGSRIGRPNKISDHDRDLVMKLFESQVPVREIARRLPHLSRSSIQAIIKKRKGSAHG